METRTKERRFTHLTWNDRLKIERMLKERYTNQEIADAVHVSIRTIFREKKRGLCVQRDSELREKLVYCADVAQRDYERNLAAKGPDLKIANDHALAKYLEEKIVDEKCSPRAALMAIDLEGKHFDTSISVWTLYSYIDKGVFLRLTNKSLPVKGNQKSSYKVVQRAARAPRGDSIEARPEEIDSRETFGHWEMDSVVGKKETKKRLLVLTERKTRHEIVVMLENGRTETVVSAINALEKLYGPLRFKKIFQSITVDNGSEFADYAGIERSCIEDAERTHVYFCHPYSSFERGSNENNNKLIRRWLPKGTDFTDLTEKEVLRIENWMNNYPRKKLSGYSSRLLFQAELAALGLDDPRAA